MSNISLDSYIDRMFSLEKEKKQATDMIKDLKSEAKSNGFDSEAISEVVKRRLMDEKKIAKLREKAPDAGPYLLKTNMAAGHGGKSGRFQRLEEVAFEYAFAVKMAGKM